MNEDKANQILGNIQQLTESVAPKGEIWLTREARDRALAVRNEAFWAALDPQLKAIRSGMATSETADNIERLVKEIL